jgi:hypothetical protein
MSIVNFDNVINEIYGKKEDGVQDHFCSPKHPFRMCIIGGSGSGKTNILLNLLFNYLKFDKIYLYAHDLEEEKYQFLIEYMTTLTKKYNKEKKKDLKLIEFSNNIKDVVDVDKIDDTIRNILIFDDMVLERKQDAIEEAFIRARKKNTSCIYISQSYFKIPKTIRLNSTYFILNKIATRKEITQIASDHATTIEYDEFMKIYRKATEEPHTFLLIDKVSTELPLQYRKNFDCLYIPDS